MSDPLDILMDLNAITLTLDEVQSWIDYARSVAQTNQVVQLELDRQQASVDAKRKFVEMTKLDIASRN